MTTEEIIAATFIIGVPVIVCTVMVVYSVRKRKRVREKSISEINSAGLISTGDIILKGHVVLGLLWQPILVALNTKQIFLTSDYIPFIHMEDMEGAFSVLENRSIKDMEIKILGKRKIQIEFKFVQEAELKPMKLRLSTIKKNEQIERAVAVLKSYAN